MQLQTRRVSYVHAVCVCRCGRAHTRTRTRVGTHVPRYITIAQRKEEGRMPAVIQRAQFYCPCVAAKELQYVEPIAGSEACWCARARAHARVCVARLFSTDDEKIPLWRWWRRVLRAAQRNGTAISPPRVDTCLYASPETCLLCIHFSV